MINLNDYFMTFGYFTHFFFFSYSQSANPLWKNSKRKIAGNLTTKCKLERAYDSTLKIITIFLQIAKW